VGISAGQLHGMGGVDDDRHAQTLHLADASMSTTRLL
jgi:hypothetical protein